nr:hypothetical protein [Candidatus Sigynarchaeota archaeon]
TADALAIFSIIGYPAGFESTEVPQIIDRFSRVQIGTGGWAVEDDDGVTPAGHCAQIIAALARFAGRNRLGTINIDNLKRLFQASALPGSGLMAYAPYPSYQPPLDACRDAIDMARIGHLLDPAVEAAARAMIGATGEGNSYPLTRHNLHTISYCDAAEFRSQALSGVACLEHRVALKDSLAMSFTMTELSEILAQLQGMQVREELAGIQGLCFAMPWYRTMITTSSGLLPRAASLESTLAAVRAIRTLSTYGNGTIFVMGDILDLSILYARLATDYRESAAISWFEREYPVSFQSPAGFDNAKLRDTRLVLEILNTTSGFTHAAISAAISVHKLSELALTEPRQTVTDIDNALTILAILNQTIPQATLASIAGELARFRVTGGAWFSRLGLPHFGETMKAYRILARFKGLRVTLDHVVESEGMIHAMAGSTISLCAELVNCFCGIEPSWSYTFSAWPLGISGNASTMPVPITMPLAEEALGPGSITVTMPVATLCPSMTISITISGALAIEPSGDPITLTTARREPLAAVLRLVIVNPDNGTEMVDVWAGTIIARGLSINYTGYFLLDNSSASGRYMTMLGVNPLEESTMYRVEASRAFCEQFVGILAVRCGDNLSWSPAITLPLSCSIIIAAAGLVKTHVVKRRRMN